MAARHGDICRYIHRGRDIANDKVWWRNRCTPGRLIAPVHEAMPDSGKACLSLERYMRGVPLMEYTDAWIMLELTRLRMTPQARLIALQLMM